MYYIYAWYIKAFGFYFGRTGHMYIIYTIFPNTDEVWICFFVYIQNETTKSILQLNEST